MSTIRESVIKMLSSARAVRAFEFDPDQPRDDEGQWTDGGGSSGSGSGDKSVGGPPRKLHDRFPKKKNDPPATVEHVRAMAAKLGVEDITKVGPITHSVAGFSPSSIAGMYSPATEEITISASYLKRAPKSHVEAVVRHEAQHHRFAKAMYLNPDKSARNYMNANRSALIKEDGNTSYSKLYWNRYERQVAQNGADSWGALEAFDLAVNESLSEMHAVRKGVGGRSRYPHYRELNEIISRVTGFPAGPKGVGPK